ncbi:unnamed protein product [Prorocentrum cordatum]|uniref:Secreted protein n=1 Tax=Prorocentrum cordatum TaxID=2364126 RepID=A0ABN9UAD5_9DINO|nr:unnamed protein product [Polarella glacialis]|mmetsp:Transcript_78392/g.204354  ORF Transcript_78392/g.204354 Transcript_78392/m.204354 type:complete len:217 (+) Transcript_78392:86-736(+)
MARLNVVLFALTLGVVEGARHAKMFESDDALLACTDFTTEDRLIIAAADKPYWDYMYETGTYYTQARFRHSTKAELDKFKSKLTCTEIIGKMPRTLKCAKCASTNTNKPSLWLSRCAAAKDLDDFKRIQEEVASEDGSCLVGGDLSFGQTVSECSASKVIDMDAYNFTVFQSCVMESDAELEKEKTDLQAKILSLKESSQSIDNKHALLDKLFRAH